MRHFFIFTLAFVISNAMMAQNALNLDGTNDYVQTNYPGITGSSARSIEAWIKTTQNADPGAGGLQQTLVDWGTFVTGGRFTFNILFGNAIRLEVQGNGVNGTIAVNDGIWHHVAAVYDPSATNEISLYVDGVLDVANNLTVAVNTLSSVNLRIGQRVDGVNRFGGSIDEVRVWNKALSHTDILALMDTTFCSPQTDLVAYYKFNQAIPGGNNSAITSLMDMSGNNYDGVLNNFGLMGSVSNWVQGVVLNGPGSAPVTSQTIAACEAYHSTNGNIYTTSGVYTDTISSVLTQCDSIVQLNLTVNYGPTGQDSIVACHQYNSPHTGQVITASGTFVDSIPGLLGVCDSLITTVVTILPVSSIGTLLDTVCDSSFSYISPSGKFTWTSPGVYHDTVVQSASGCQDITVFLTLYDPVVSATISGTTLSTATVTGATYEWLDCDNVNTPVPGETSNSFTATQNGNYAVVVHKDNCSDTSDCYPVVEVGLDEMNTNLPAIVPNPGNGTFSMELANYSGPVNLKVFSQDGRQVFSQQFTSNQIRFHLDAEPGIYLVYLYVNGKRMVGSLVLQ